MTEFFNSMVGFEKILWMIAIVSSLVFLVQTAMVIFGGDVDSDTDFDTDIDVDVDVDNAQSATGHSFGWFSFRNLVNFFLLFSWVGISCLDHGLSTGLSLLIASASGVAFGFVVALMYKGMKSLSQDGSTSLSTVIGHTCTVYLTVPKNGRGKVTIDIGGVKTMDAISETDEFKTGTLVKVTGVADNILIVGVRDKNNK